jgi:phosphoribosylglycinamide formyltransferase-1
MKNIAVFVSGNGTNLQAIIDNIRRGALKACLALVVSDNPKAFALKRAEKAGVKTLYADPKKFASRRDYEAFLVAALRKEMVGLVVMAGFMRIVSPYFVRSFKNRIVNIHPALLPAFKGMDAIKEAYRYGARVTGVTIHFVDEKVDHGPIILQEAVLIREGESVARLEERIHEVEHRIYSQAIARVLSGKAVVRGRRVVRGRGLA